MSNAAIDLSSEYSNVSQSARLAIAEVVSRYPNRCGRDVLRAAHLAAAKLQPNVPLGEVDMFVFLELRQECGMDCDEECPVTGKPCRN